MNGTRDGTRVAVLIVTQTDLLCDGPTAAAENGVAENGVAKHGMCATTTMCAATTMRA
jgi:hypothetical protein